MDTQVSNTNRSFLQTVRDSAINVGLTLTAGAAAGEVGGTIATLVPYKIKPEALNHQYGDMFVRATATQKTPEYLKGAGDVLDIVKNGRPVHKRLNAYAISMDRAETMLENIRKMKPENLAKADIQAQIQTFFKDVELPQGGYTKEAVLARLEKQAEGILKSSEAKSEHFATLKKQFVEKIAELKDPNITKMAEVGAKKLRNHAIKGVAVGIGIIGALVINLLISNGAIGGKKSSKEA